MSPLRQHHRVAFVSLLLVVLHFAVGPWLGDRRAAPDLLLLALLVYAVRAKPGKAAAAGFAVGLLRDALTVVGFGSNALALTVVGYLAAWGKAVFFADNIIVNGAFFWVGTWIADLLAATAGGYFRGADLLWQLGFWSVVKGLGTAAVGMVVLFLFRGWLAVRVTE